MSSGNELDIHANMVVISRNCLNFDKVQGQTCGIEPFDTSIGTDKKFPIFDEEIAYSFTYSHKTYLLLVKNALHVKVINKNLLPHFILREYGIKVNDMLRIHVHNPKVKYHSIYMQEIGILIPLQL